MSSGRRRKMRGEVSDFSLVLIVFSILLSAGMISLAIERAGTCVKKMNGEIETPPQISSSGDVEITEGVFKLRTRTIKEK